MKLNATINYKGVDLDIEYYFQPEEKAERGQEAKYPGCYACVEEIYEIKHKGTCMYELLEDKFDEIEELIINTLKTEHNE